MPKEYKCPRCGYTCSLKKHIRQHFSRKKACQDRFDVRLTEEIIEKVCDEGFYHPSDPSKSAKSINIGQIVNNYNTMNNLVVQMDFNDKMFHLLDYQKRNLLCFEDNLEQRFEYRVKRLEDDKYRDGYYLSQDDLFGLVNDVTKIDREHLEKFNILFDKAIKRFKLYRGKSWESFLEDIGAKELVSLIKSYYLDTYEVYLIKHLHREGGTKLNRSKLAEHLEIYYRFIAAFDLAPYVVDNSDEELLGHRLVESSSHLLAEKYMTVYCEQKGLVKPSEKNRIKRKIISIVKENTIHNISELNQTVLDILKVDENFREVIVKSLEIERCVDN
jgi:hypothetical protein